MNRTLVGLPTTTTLNIEINGIFYYIYFDFAAWPNKSSNKNLFYVELNVGSVQKLLKTYIYFQDYRSNC